MNMQDSRWATIATAVLILLTSFKAHAVPILEFSPSPTATGVGASFSVDIVASGFADLFGYQGSVLFDPEILSADAITEGTFLSSAGGTFFLGDVDTAPGGALFFSILLSPTDTFGASGSGVLATLDFTSLARGFSQFTFSNLLLIDSAGDPIETATSQGSVSVPEPSSLALISLGLLGLLAGYLIRPSKHSSFRA